MRWPRSEDADSVATVFEDSAEVVKTAPTPLSCDTETTWDVDGEEMVCSSCPADCVTMDELFGITACWMDTICDVMFCIDETGAVSTTETGDWLTMFCWCTC